MSGLRIPLEGKQHRDVNLYHWSNYSGTYLCTNVYVYIYTHITINIHSHILTCANADA